MSASSWLSPLPKGPCNSPRGSTSLFLLLVSLLPHLLYHSRLLQKTQGPSQHSPGVWTLQSCPTLGWQVSQHALSLLSLHVHSRHVAVGDRGSHTTPALQRVMNHSQAQGHHSSSRARKQADETSLDLLVHVKDSWILLRPCSACCHLVTALLRRENR